MTQITRQPNQLLNMPPIYTTNIMLNGKLTVAWQKWFSTVYAVHTQTFKAYNMSSVSGVPATQIQLPVLPGFTSDQINALQNVDDGAQVYNKTTNKGLIRENGVWVELT